MADYTVTAALNAADIPTVTRFQQRAAMIAGLDGRLRDPASSNTQNLDNNPNDIPQVLYAENVIPTKGGVKSVGYFAVQNAVAPATTLFDDVFILRDASENITYWSPARGMNFVTANPNIPWVSTAPVAGAPLALNFAPSIAYVNGATYCLFSSTWLGLWDGTTFVDKSGLLVGVAVNQIRAICGSGNYLIAVCSDNSVKWSSLTDPLDFTVSVLTGAGSQIPSDIRGPASYLTPMTGGFLIHCVSNTVAAVYTQNSAAPWIFREVKGSGGYLGESRLIGKDSNAGLVYMLGSSGLQALNLRDADIIHPQITDFLGTTILESFDTTTNLLSIIKGVTLNVKINVIGGRYLCVSYGSVDGPYTYIFWYDFALKRWGKLKVDHVDIFTNPIADLSHAVYVLKNDGSTYSVSLDDTGIIDSGVLILGKYQLNRSNRLCTQQVELEVLDGAEAVTATALVYDNGSSDPYSLALTPATTSDNYRKYQGQAEGTNIAILLKGTFTLATAILTFTKGADNDS